jgi:hypothetical protein
MPYASTNRVSHKQHEGSRALLDAQGEPDWDLYTSAREKLINGGTVFWHNDELIITDKAQKKAGHKEPVWQNGEWYHEPLPEPESVKDDEPAAE